MNTTQAIRIQELFFSYKGATTPVIQNLSLSIPEGSRFGLFGPNGAGKTTLMSLMTGLLSYQSGSVQLFGKEIKKNKKFVNNIIGYVPQDFSFYEELTPQENMQFFGAWYGLSSKEIKSKTNILLETMGLSDVHAKTVKQFSGGMKRRVNLAIGVMNNPRILFLDEPTVGVDVQSRNAILDFLKKINSQGTTLVYTSHQLKEAEELCDYIALVDEGKIIVDGTIDTLKREFTENDLEGLFLKLTGRAYRD